MTNDYSALRNPHSKVSFLFPMLLTIGLPLLAVPVIIHLINLRRHRRIRWAAMEFLLASQKRRRKWVILKQLLLLLTRMAVFAAIVFMLARPVLQESWGALVGGLQTHHIILLDDSYSMSDRGPEGATAFDQAKRVVDEIVQQSIAQGGEHHLTLIRFSEAGRLSVGTQPDVFRRAVSEELRADMESYFAATPVSETDAGPREAVAAAARLPEPTSAETRLVYLVSDFRRRQWDRPVEIRDALGRLREQVSRLHLVHCARSERPNLALTELRPPDGTGAAGTEMWIEVTLMNHSDEPASGVAVQIEQDGENRGAIEVETIPPREELTSRIRATFASVGPHTLAAHLPADAVDADNHRYAALQIPAGYPILIIDGTQTGRDGFYLSSALAPGGSARTNWQPQVEPPSFLRRQERLADYAAIFLLDVSRLDRAEVDALERYVEGGGGLGIFLGSNVDPAFYNSTLYRDGQGVFPAPLTVPTQLLHGQPMQAPDVEATDHPIFRAFTTARNTFLDAVLIEYYYGVDRGWSAGDAAEVRPIATVRGRAPLVLEKTFGDGRVVAFLTKLSSERTPLGRWNNWLGNPMFPVMALEAASYLSAPTRTPSQRTVGEPLVIAAPETEFEPDFLVTAPGGPASVPQETSLAARPSDGQLVAVVPGTDFSGIYEVQLTRRDGGQTALGYAVNVPEGEGDLRTVSRSELETKLEGVPHAFLWADAFTQHNTSLAGFQLSDTLLYVLIGLLILEQLLAYSASYHPAAPPARRAAA